MTLFSSLAGDLLSIELGNGDTAVLFTMARRKAAVNRGMQEFADLTECHQRIWYSSWTGGIGQVSLSTWVTAQDYVRPSQRPVAFLYTNASSEVTVLEGDLLPRRDPVWLATHRPGWDPRWSTGTTGQVLPELYYLQPSGNDLLLGFTPVPSTGSSASITVALPYIARPEPMTSDTQEPFVVTSTNAWENVTHRFDLRPYHQALVHYAAAKLEGLRRDPGAAQLQMQAFLAYVARYRQAIRQKGGTVVGYVKNYFNVRGSDVGVDPRR